MGFLWSDRGNLANWGNIEAKVLYNIHIIPNSELLSFQILNTNYSHWKSDLTALCISKRYDVQECATLGVY
jgi:hypothetical protein